MVHGCHWGSSSPAWLKNVGRDRPASNIRSLSMHLSIWGHHQSCRHQHRHHIGLSGHDHVLPLGLILRDQLSRSPTWFWPGSCIDIGIDGSWTDITSHLEQKHQNLSNWDFEKILQIISGSKKSEGKWLSLPRHDEVCGKWVRETPQRVSGFTLSLSELGMAGEHTQRRNRWCNETLGRKSNPPLWHVAF